MPYLQAEFLIVRGPSPAIFFSGTSEPADPGFM